jgi:hypothetical protein
LSRYTTDVHAAVGSLRPGGLRAAAPGTPNTGLEAGPEHWYLLTLAPRGFFWFRLVSEEENERDAS